MRTTRPSRPGRPADAGMVTAEAALALPVLVLVLAGAVAAVAVLAAQLRCVDAAREGVLAAARGEDGAAVRSLVESTAPAGAAVQVDGPAGDRVSVTVTAVVTPLGAVPWSVRLSASATARPEPGAAATP